MDTNLLSSNMDNVISDFEISEINSAMYELLRVMAINSDRLHQSVSENKPHVFANQMLEFATAYK